MQPSANWLNSCCKGRVVTAADVNPSEELLAAGVPISMAIQPARAEENTGFHGRSAAWIRSYEMGQ